jgi:Fe-S cluster biogenesis protein NfuA
VLKPQFIQLISDHISNHLPILDTEDDTLKQKSNDSEVVALIKELIAVRIRPSIMEDGGDIEFKGYDEKTGIVLVALKGACQGCPMSADTLSNGVEKLLKYYVEEIKEVRMIEDDPVPSNDKL